MASEPKEDHIFRRGTYSEFAELNEIWDREEICSE